ncbi:nucleotidyltransferase family protein, partial [bacterium]|nr:nucleotidyltransferase family protein [bacterium]
MNKKDQIMHLLQKKYPYLKSEFGVKRIGLFGSISKGVNSEDSDVDLVIEFDKPIGFRFIKLAEYLENYLGSPVDILTPAG